MHPFHKKKGIIRALLRPLFLRPVPKGGVVDQPSFPLDPLQRKTRRVTFCHDTRLYLPFTWSLGCANILHTKASWSLRTFQSFVFGANIGDGYIQPNINKGCVQQQKNRPQPSRVFSGNCQVGSTPFTSTHPQLEHIRLLLPCFVGLNQKLALVKKNMGSLKLPGCKFKKKQVHLPKIQGIFSNTTSATTRKQRQLLVPCFQTAPNPQIAWSPHDLQVYQWPSNSFA